MGRVPARCAKPSGRSLELRSNAWPRGMAVLRYVVAVKDFGPRRCFVQQTEFGLQARLPTFLNFFLPAELTSALVAVAN